MPDTKQTVLEQAVADQWKVLPSGLTVLVRPMPCLLYTSPSPRDA